MAETVISMAILTILLSSVFTILMFSTRLSRQSLDTISDTNSEVVRIYDNVSTLSTAQRVPAEIKLTFKIDDTDGGMVVSQNEYAVSAGAFTYLTDSGLMIVRGTT